eukprot:TRINITY_DN22230_c0_g1_i1.p1 TRINITY_DN22230_c0_g1~~TRINITY_DN22230_c0_g1_i1.p1  ORF type:complete len:198 (+),score=24.34 TRINITY_DN22230_c0_g1_i1:27-620(+)
MAACVGALTTQSFCFSSSTGSFLSERIQRPSARCVHFELQKAVPIGCVVKNVRLSVVASSKLDTGTASNSSSAEDEEEKVEVYVDPKRALKEVFTTRDTGKYECKSCGYAYETSVGDSTYPVPRGTLFSELPSDWACPTCGAGKVSFKSTGVEVAGFAENQKYGLGTNSMTSGQKSVLIYGSLFLFFLFFLSGYLLQ